MTRFETMYRANLDAGKYVCVGLDPDMSKAPGVARHGKSDALDMLWFVCAIVDATHPYAAAFKLQSAYYEEHGSEGIKTLELVVDYIRHKAPDVPIILDYKRGDIDRTAAAYMRSAFVNLDVDAVTVNPYLGMVAMKPFLDQEDKHIIVICRTSNDGAGELQDVLCSPVVDSYSGKYYATEAEAIREKATGELIAGATLPFYQFVALRVARNWNYNGNCAVVVGATVSKELERVRQLVGGDMLILVPGIGTQGGSLEESIRRGHGRDWVAEVFNNSSAIMFAYSKAVLKSDGSTYGRDEWAEAAGNEACKMNDAIAALLV
jgi:orotidine-5'-phosphate decarboxylase